MVPESETAEVLASSEYNDEQISAIQDAQEDKVLPLQGTVSAELTSHWDSIILTLAVMAEMIDVYYIIKYLIGKSAESLNLDKGELRGVYSITKLVLTVIAIKIIIHFFLFERNRSWYYQCSSKYHNWIFLKKHY
jgi:hypothetical protein